MAQVIFTQNIRGVAQMGDIKKVADGYARNFLFPRKMAVLATPDNLKQVKVLKQKRMETLEKDKETTKALAEKIQNTTLEIARAASEEDTLYDGLDAAEISAYLKKQNLGIEPEAVLLKEPIKKLGEFSVELDLGYDLKASLKVMVRRPAE